MVLSLERDSLLMDRVERLLTIPAVGPDHRVDLGRSSRGTRSVFLRSKSDQLLRPLRSREEFGEHRAAYAAVQTAQQALQATLIEAAKMAPRYSPNLAMLYDKEKQKGNANRANAGGGTELVAYLMAIDRGQRNFQAVETNCIAA